jgi:4-diphosphocytidyl-2-C-methyl-D-erythritol kinase
MIEFPNAKINLGLNVISKRIDGFHNIETLMVPIELTDILDLSRGSIRQQNKVEITTTGLVVDGNTSDNLIVKAYDLVDADFDLPPVTVHLHKAIPMGAGLGGGSSDGAFMIKILNHYFDLELSTEQMEQYASKLGSDCPFFIRNKPAFAYGRGTDLKHVNFNLDGLYIVLIVPPVHVSTKLAYSLIKPIKPAQSIEDFFQLQPEHWRGNLVNDFEQPVFEKFPRLLQIKDMLYNQGATYVSMSGSGSSVFGIFRQQPDLRLIKAEDCFIWATNKIKAAPSF